jgi:hypothetical protein
MEDGAALCAEDIGSWMVDSVKPFFLHPPSAIRYPFRR